MPVVSSEVVESSKDINKVNDNSRERQETVLSDKPHSSRIAVVVNED